MEKTWSAEKNRTTDNTWVEEEEKKRKRGGGGGGGAGGRGKYSEQKGAL